MHIDARLAPCPGYGWEGGPQFRTEIVSLANGDEYRNGEWIEARHSFSTPFNNITSEAFRELKRMFLVCRGMLHAFRFEDRLDAEATDELFAFGDGATRLFQLRKISIEDGVEYPRNVYALPSVPTITINGVATAAFAINLRTGQIEFTVAPAIGAALRWTGPFELWVRFATDDLRFSLDNPNRTNGVVSVVEVPPPDEPVTP
jgi:uncharacterized protein (TIGR02217 family)